MDTDHVLTEPLPVMAPKVRAAMLHVLNEVEHSLSVQQLVLLSVAAGQVPSLEELTAQSVAVAQLSAAINTVRLLLADSPSLSVQ